MKFSFQTILIIVFIAAFLVAVIVFSGLLSSGSTTSESTEPTGQVVIWGVLPNTTMQTYITDFNNSNLGYRVYYEEHRPESMYQDLIFALANNAAPDLVVYSSEIFSQFKDKLYTIPYQAYSERTYRDTNIDGAQIFLTPEGTIGFPLLIDPLVVYYNKDILAAQNFVTPPRTWNTLLQANTLLTKRTTQGTISQSMIALGETTNVPHYRDILSALFLQTGNTIVTTDKVTGAIQSTLTTGSGLDGAVSPTTQALLFYTNFANPTNSAYSWNRSLPDALQHFLAGRSAFYIGRASELFSIQAQNPNLNFDVMELFQSPAATRSVTYGSFLGVGVMKAAPNFTAAYAALTKMSSPADVDALSKRFSLPPARRDLLLVGQQNPYISVFFKAALATFSWPDQNSTRTKNAFRDMIQKVNSGSTDPQLAIYEASLDLQAQQ